MCGIVGVVSKTRTLSKEEKTVFKNLLLVDQLRGTDSTGIIAHYYEKDKAYVTTDKKAVSAGNYLHHKSFNGIMEQDGLQAVIGHNRYATSGAVTERNAHPFTHDHIRMVHNGTLWTGWEKKLCKGESISVDSEGICFSLSKRGISDTLKNIEGAFALAWHDASDSTVHLVRNFQRPMAVAETSGAWFFASEKAMLEFVLTRSKLSGKVEELPAWDHITFSLTNTGSSVAKEEIPLAARTTSYNNRDDDLWDAYTGSYRKQSAHNSWTPRDSGAAMLERFGAEIIMVMEEWSTLGIPSGMGNVRGHLESYPDISVSLPSFFPTKAMAEECGMGPYYKDRYFTKNGRVKVRLHETLFDGTKHIQSPLFIDHVSDDEFSVPVEAQKNLPAVTDSISYKTVHKPIYVGQTCWQCSKEFTRKQVVRGIILAPVDMAGSSIDALYHKECFHVH